MKVGIYNPYFSILGGAERYVLSIAKCLESDAKIILYNCDEDLVNKMSKKFDINLANYSTKSWPQNRLQLLLETRQLQCLFYITDGSIFNSFAKKNFLIIQSPAHIPRMTLRDHTKLASWQKIIVYSKFMADIVEQKLNKKAIILFVPIQKPQSSSLKKENIIISVGRFFPHLHNKKQLEMVKIFKEMVRFGLENTHLYLVGSVDPGAREYVYKVKEAAKNYPITIETNLTFSDLINLYKKAKIYWHAAGYQEDINLYPEKAEHFGVVIVEAMSYGVVPIVFNAGGPRELVHSGIDGFTWNSQSELIAHTQNLLKNDDLREKMTAQAITFSHQFTQENFCQNLYEVVNN